MIEILKALAIEGDTKPNLKNMVPQATPSNQMVQSVLNSVYAIMGLVAVGFIIYGGCTWIMSQGDSNKLAKARNAIIYAVIGLIIVLLAAVITNFVITASLGAGDAASGGTVSEGGFIVGGF